MNQTALGALPLLRSLKVLELGHYIAAPFATRLLADLGADVIKIEPPGKGDPVRTWGMQVDGKSLWWSIHGRNKRSVTVNMRHPEARDLVLELAKQVDVVVENYRPGQLEKWGLGPKDFEAAKPGLVLVRISGYGQTGPEAPRSGFGVIGEAKGGSGTCAPIRKTSRTCRRSGLALRSGTIFPGFMPRSGRLPPSSSSVRAGTRSCASSTWRWGRA